MVVAITLLAISFLLLSFHSSFTEGSGYFAVDGNLPLESILP